MLEGGGTLARCSGYRGRHGRRTKIKGTALGIFWPCRGFVDGLEGGRDVRLAASIGGREESVTHVEY